MIFSLILSLVFGVAIGVLIGIYIKIRLVREVISEQIKSAIPFDFTEDDIFAVTQIIERAKKDFKNSTRGSVIRSALALKRKEKKSLVLVIKEEICEIASKFGKEGEQNLLNFSVKEFFDFLYEVTKRLEDIIEVINFSPLLAVDLSVILGLKQTADKPIIKRTAGIWGIISRVVNAINPYFWLKKLVMSLFLASIVLELSFASIETSAWQFAKFYRKP